MDSENEVSKQGTWQVHGGWSSLAGNLDGDGTGEFNIHPFTLTIRLAFDENWRPHLEGSRGFLGLRGMARGVVRRRDGYNTWHVVVSNIEGVALMAKKMLPCEPRRRSS